jgi:tetratricopeptide (TPR) repeat protein
MANAELTAGTMLQNAEDTALDPAAWTMDDGVNWGSYVQDTRNNYIVRYAAFARLNTRDFSSLEREMANVLNAAEQASVQQADDKLLEMADSLWIGGGQFLDLRGHAQYGRVLLTQAVNAARRLGDETREEHLLGQLGRAWVALGDLENAAQNFEQALVLARELGNQDGEASHLGNLGQIELQEGNKHKAAKCFGEAVTIAKSIGNRPMEGRLWASLACLKLVQDTRKGTIEAIADLREAIEIAKEVGDRRGEASHLGSLGRAYELLGVRALSLPPFVGGPYLDSGESEYRKALERANREAYYRSCQYYGDALTVAAEVNDLELERRFRGDRHRVAKIAEFWTDSSGAPAWNTWARNPRPDGLASTSHWDLEPRLVKALLPPDDGRW